MNDVHYDCTGGAGGASGTPTDRDCEPSRYNKAKQILGLRQCSLLIPFVKTVVVSLQMMTA